MANDITVNSFPKTDLEALAYLYVKNQDLSGKTPTEINNMYWTAYYEIREDNSKKIIDGYFKTKNTNTSTNGLRNK